MPRLALALALLLPLAACGSDEPAEPATGSIADAANSVEALPASGETQAAPVSGATIVDLVSAAPDLSILNRLIGTSGIAETLKAEGPFTLFAPSDAAFAGMDVSALEADPDALRAILTAHALPFRTLSDGMDFEQTVESLGGTEITVLPGAPPGVSSGGTRASIVRADMDAANGVVHVIDAVLPSN